MRLTRLFSHRSPLPFYVAQEAAKNVVFGLFPGLMYRGQTGRGPVGDAPEKILEHGRAAFLGQFADPGEAERLLTGKLALELGPGDTLVTGLLALAHGARRWVAVDSHRFPLDTPLNAAVYELLRQGLPSAQRACVDAALSLEGGRIRLDPARIGFVYSPIESFSSPEPVDFLFSSSVLEHVRNLPRAFASMAAACRPGGLISHRIDLADHDIYPGEPLQFLTYSPRVWALMHGLRGTPNRCRLPDFRRLAEAAGLKVLACSATELYPAELVAAARPRLHPAFARLSDDELRAKSIRLRAERL